LFTKQSLPEKYSSGGFGGVRVDRNKTKPGFARKTGGDSV